MLADRPRRPAARGCGVAARTPAAGAVALVPDGFSGPRRRPRRATGAGQRGGARRAGRAAAWQRRCEHAGSGQPQTPLPALVDGPQHARGRESATSRRRRVVGDYAPEIADTPDAAGGPDIAGDAQEAPGGIRCVRRRPGRRTARRKMRTRRKARTRPKAAGGHTASRPGCAGPDRAQWPSTWTPSLPAADPVRAAGSGGLAVVCLVRPTRVQALDGALAARAVSLFTVNRRPPAPDGDGQDAAFAFQVEMNVEADRPLIPRVNLNGLDSGDWDERLAVCTIAMSPSTRSATTSRRAPTSPALNAAGSGPSGCRGPACRGSNRP